MKRIIITSDGRYTHHGIGDTDHEGYAGTADNRLSIKRAIACEVGRGVAVGESYQLEVNNEIRGVFTKQA